jgi:hypothetical protein
MFSEISDSRGGEYERDRLLDCCAMNSCINLADISEMLTASVIRARL